MGTKHAHIKGAWRELKLIAHRDLVITPHDWLQHGLQPLQSPWLICTPVVCPFLCISWRMLSISGAGETLFSGQEVIREHESCNT